MSLSSVFILLKLSNLSQFHFLCYCKLYFLKNFIFLLLVYKNTVDFYLFTWYATTLYNSVVVLHSLGFLYRKIIMPWTLKTDNFISSFQFLWVLFISLKDFFFFLIVLFRSCRSCQFGGKVFSLFTIKYGGWCRVFYRFPLSAWGSFLLFLVWLEFYHQWILNFIKYFV